MPARTQTHPRAPKKRLRRGIVYKLTNRETGAYYVGKTKQSLAQRLYLHLVLGINRFIRYDLAFYGPDVFTIEVIEDDIPLGHLDRRETYWIRTLDPPYNLRKTKKKWGKNQHRKNLLAETPHPDPNSNPN